MISNNDILKETFDYIRDVNKKVDDLTRSVQKIGDHQFLQLHAEDFQTLDGPELRRIMGMEKDTYTKLLKDGRLTPLPLAQGMHPRFNLLQLAHDLNLPLIHLKFLAARSDQDYFHDHIEQFQTDVFKNKGLEARLIGQVKFWIDHEWKKEQSGEASYMMPVFREAFEHYFK